MGTSLSDGILRKLTWKWGTSSLNMQCAGQRRISEEFSYLSFASSFDKTYIPNVRS